MFHFHCRKSHFYLKLKGILTTAPTPSPFSLRYFSSTSDKHSFAVSYLINNCGFSPEAAFKASNRVRFESSEKPDSVLNFFRNHGFSNYQIQDVVRKRPELLSCNPHKIVLPKFEFLLSKGASISDITRMVTKGPSYLDRSLENHIIPAYGLVSGFLQSDKKTVDCIINFPHLISRSVVALNVKLLLDNGVANSSIARLVRIRPCVLCSSHLSKVVEEAKELGFDPSKSYFLLALMAKISISKSGRDAKVDAYKRWGWSVEEIEEAFRRNPRCMLASKDKINAVMSYWINHLGWNSLTLAKFPEFFVWSLEKRIIPRASILQFLLSKGLRNKNASLYTPFHVTEKLFLDKFVHSFKEESSMLLKLYEEKLNIRDNRENSGTPHPSIKNEVGDIMDPFNSSTKVAACLRVSYGVNEYDIVKEFILAGKLVWWKQQMTAELKI